MAGTLVADTISDGSGNTTAMTNAVQGSAKAWVNFNGASGSIYASYNVSSVTRNAMGKFTVNFTNAFSDINYSFMGSATYSSPSNQSAWLAGPGDGALARTTWKTTSSVQVFTYYQNATVSNSDPTDICVAVFR